MSKQVFSLRSFSVAIIFSLLFIPLSSFTDRGGSLTNDVLFYTNQFRKQKGKPALVMKESLNTLARKHSENMASGRVSVGHSGFEQRHNQVKKIYSSCTMAENVAWGVSTGKDVVKMWQNSSGHRVNLLGNYKYIGIGTASDKRGRIYYTQIFVR
ncbi:MAG TPA: CAP domain-containing protein [Chitinophagaceae bacterium]